MEKDRGFGFKTTAVKILLSLFMVLSIFFMVFLFYLSDKKIAFIMFLVLCLIINIKSRKLAVYFLAFIISFSIIPPSNDHFGMTNIIFAACLFLTSIFFSLDLLFERKILLRLDKTGILLSLFFLSGITSIFISFLSPRGGSISTFNFLLTNINFLLIYLLSINIVKRSEIDNIFLSVLFGAFMTSLYAFYQFFTGVNRVNSIVYHPNIYGMFIAMCVPVCFHYLLTGKRMILSFFLNIILFLALVLTFSRGAFIGLFVSLSIYLYFYYHKKNIKIKKPFFYSFVSVLLASFFIIIIFLGFNGVFHRFYGTLAERVLSFQEGVDYRVGVFCETIQNNEVLTLFGSKNSFDSEIFAGTYYLELLIRVGFIGLAVFLILSFIALKNFKKLRYSYPAVFCIIIFLIHCLVDVGHGILALFSLYLSLVSIDLRKPRP